MSIFKSFDKVLASLGNSKAMNRLSDDSPNDETTEEIVGEKIAESKDGQINVGIQELSGYLFLEAFILSTVNIKTLNGAKLIFTSNKDNFILSSDTQEIKSEYSNNSYKYFTQISFDISEDEIELIKKGAFTKVQLDFKRKSLVFDKTI